MREYTSWNHNNTKCIFAGEQCTEALTLQEDANLSLLDPACDVVETISRQNMHVTALELRKDTFSVVFDF